MFTTTNPPSVVFSNNKLVISINIVIHSKTLLLKIYQTKNTGRVNGQYPVGTYNRNARVNVNSLNVRKGRPRTGGYDTILGQLKKGEVVKVGYCLGNWFGIIYKGQQAFICGDYVELE